ncbi:LysE family translocator [Pseudoduganella ginsengisoli]|uniref:LysE family translocator n=1 Tax=Pseudoduganella ginsengisoli TaxID=1462440 RepID=A0A6L6Q063_9BURK|nr:LysE family transporter [Pseudoduganella ginsengisoli]MTW03020.1 LysE family translocator [Pseudoduganella ginsengisoli]
MPLSLWLSFVAVALAATFSPGPGVLLAISTTLALGARRTLYSSAGNAAGVFIVSCVAVSGAGLLFSHSPAAFSLLKTGGAAYLAWLGIQQWRQAATPAIQTADGDGSRRAVFMRGLAVACSNPKSILFFTAVFPQFLPMQQMTGPRFLLLSLTFVVCMFVSHATYVLLAAKAGTRLLHGGAMRVLRRCMGALFVLMAAGLLLTKL